MPEALAIALDLPLPEARALLACLRSELQRALAEHWYDDRYRGVPEGLRSRRILADYPALAGNKRTIRALKSALDGKETA